MNQIQTAQHFAPIIKTLTPAELQGAPSLYEKLCIERQGDLEVTYTPFEYVNTQARIVVVGITPGKTQVENAVRELRSQLDRGVPLAEALVAAKRVGAFSGPMRKNLVGMLDFVGVNRWLGIGTCDDLFGKSAHLMQSTSVLRNAVFVRGENYNGTPSMTAHPLLRQHLEAGFAQDARRLPKALFVPLGDKVAEALGYLADRGVLDRSHILNGLPHPSGANAERIAYFVGTKSRETLSAKTDPAKLDRMRAQTLEQVARLAA